MASKQSEYISLRSGELDGEPMAIPVEVAKYLRTTTARLANDRSLKRGIPYVKYGSSVLYRWRDVHTWIERNTKATADEA
jgi:hypothetical protein